jgi:hypothetical protein
MAQEYLVDDFLFLYELEPYESCLNFRFDSGTVCTYGSPLRELSFSLWKNMLAIGYCVHKGTERVEVARGEAHYFATAIIASYGFLTSQALQYSIKNWVEFEAPTPADKIIAGNLSATEPPTNHEDNEPLKQVATLMPLVLNNPPLLNALDDFHSCLLNLNPNFYFYAYRAAEDIRSHFQESEKDVELAWNKMNAAVNHKKEDYKDLAELSTKFRHGNRLGEAIDQKSVQTQAEFVHALIDAFISYLSQKAV